MLKDKFEMVFIKSSFFLKFKWYQYLFNEEPDLLKDVSAFIGDLFANEGLFY